MSLLQTITSYLPQQEGLLPKWLLFVSLVSVGNSIQAYLTLSYTSRVYSGPSGPGKTPSANKSEVTGLTSRCFGTWTLIQSLVRAYVAYNITNPAFYQLGFLTYVVAFLHFGSEWFVFKSTHWGEGLAGPIFVSIGSMVWMWMVWGDYVV